jgi:hypothetical protein
MTDEAKTSTWDDVCRVADQLKLELHLAGMEAREQWEKLQPKLAELEQSFEAGAHKAGTAISEQVSSMADSLKQLLNDITSRKPS